MSEELNYEEIAKQDGWTPKDSWKGDPNRWVDAKTFVERGAQILPIVQAKNRKLVETVEELKSTVNELKEGNKLFREFHESTLAKAERERNQLISELEAQRAKAITEGDGQTFTQVDKRLQEVRAEQPKSSKKESTYTPEQQAWLAENQWYTTDRTLKAIADGLSDVLAQEMPHLSGKAFLDKLTERVKAEVPHKFENPRRQEQITGEAGRKGAKSGRGYEDLPADAKAACDKFVKTIPGYTVEKYLKAYDWE
jgi:hypothetical protein